VSNIAIIDKRERLDGQGRRATKEYIDTQAALALAREARDLQDSAVSRAEADIAERSAKLGASVSPGATVTPEFTREYELIQTSQAWLPQAREELRTLQQTVESLREKAEKARQRGEKLVTQWEDLAAKTQIYTVDTELDEIMMGYKLTFLNLSRMLMRDYMGVNWQVDHLINAVLNLPGDRRRTSTQEIIRIYRQDRDAEAMKAIARACEVLNKRELRRDGRTLVYRLVPGPGS